MGEMRNEYKILVRKPDHLEGPRHRCEDNIRTDIRETVCKDVDCMHLAQE
jgi:hypothetical protein